MSRVVEKYRRAAMSRYGISRSEAERAIVAPEDDPGQWAPRSLAVIYLEHGDAMAAALALHAPNWLDESCDLGEAAGEGYIEHINGAVAAVYPG